MRSQEDLSYSIPCRKRERDERHEEKQGKEKDADPVT